MSSINRKWYTTPVSLATSESINTVSYYVLIRNGLTPGASIICRVIGTTDDEAIATANHICKLHNDAIDETV